MYVTLAAGFGDRADSCFGPRLSTRSMRLSGRFGGAGPRSNSVFARGMRVAPENGQLGFINRLPNSSWNIALLRVSEADEYTKRRKRQTNLTKDHVSASHGASDESRSAL